RVAARGLRRGHPDLLDLTPMDADLAPPVSVEDEVARLRRTQQAGDHAQVLAAAEARLADYPENRDLLLLAGVSLRHLRRVPDAMAMLDRLARLHPAFRRLHPERGL